MKIVVVGLGYVGLSNAVLLAQKNEVVAVDISKDRVDLINSGRSPLQDEELNYYLSNKNINLSATTNLNVAVSDAEFVIIATPTNYNEVTNYFDTTSVESVIREVMLANSKASIVVKSTIPIGFINRMRDKFKTLNIFFSPEFLREGKALHDNLFPSRIIVGDRSDKAKKFAVLLSDAALKNDIEIKFMGSREAEAVKLFSNTYLAMRVAFFNELDNYALASDMSTKDIIEGVSSDPRIGMFYNNPSFGYGGYCLPKDTKQLLANYNDVPQKLITAIVDSNETRKAYLSDFILSKGPKIVGIYRLSMKSGSDNFRQSAILDIIRRLKAQNLNVIIFEPDLRSKLFEECEVISDLNHFKSISDYIVTNRTSNELTSVADKVITRDIFGSD